MKWLIYCLIYGFVVCSEAEEKKPNFILIVTDDQDVVLNGLVPMKNVQNLLVKQGITFQNAFTSSPLCCPSRATILSGMYAHNHKTTNNSKSGNCYGYHWRKYIEPNALPVQLQSNGYETFFAGKYLNEFNSDKVPPGWDHFYGLFGNSKYYNYRMNENGQTKNYTNKYLTDLLDERLIDFLKGQHTSKPFFAYVAPPAPHQPFTPADRHKDAFPDVKAPRTPNFNIPSGNLDKHWLVSFSTKIPDSLLTTMDMYYRMRWQSLLAVDEMIGNLVKTLKSIDELDNTYILFTSDNGYHIGQFAQPWDKRQPYETDIRVPFVIRGPNIGAKQISEAPVSLVDLVPTVKDLAGGMKYGNEDGISIRKFMESPNVIDKSFHRQLLIQYWGEGNFKMYEPKCPFTKEDELAGCSKEAGCHCEDSRNNTYACVRHFAYRTNRIYCEFKDNEQFVEAYDLASDQYQLTNLGYEMLPIERAMYSLSLHNMSKCEGVSCQISNF
ncbi:GNS family protein [Megaselia abdita]